MKYVPFVHRCKTSKHSQRIAKFFFNLLNLLSGHGTLLNFVFYRDMRDTVYRLSLHTVSKFENMREHLKQKPISVGCQLSNNSWV